MRISSANDLCSAACLRFSDFLLGRLVMLALLWLCGRASVAPHLGSWRNNRPAAAIAARVNSRLVHRFSTFTGGAMMFRLHAACAGDCGVRAGGISNGKQEQRVWTKAITGGAIVLGRRAGRSQGPTETDGSKHPHR